MPGGAPRCRSVIDRMYLQFIPTHKLDAVVIAAKRTLNDIPGSLTPIESIRGVVPEVYVFGPIVAYGFVAATVNKKRVAPRPIIDYSE